MKPRRSNIAAIWAVSCWPAVNFIARNWTEVLRGGLQCLSGVAAITVCAALVGHGLLRYRARSDREDIIVPWTVAICLFFGYLALRDFFDDALHRIHLGVPASAGWLVCAAVAMYFAWRLRGSARMQIAATTFAFVATGAAIVALAGAMLRSPATAPAVANAADMPVGSSVVRADENIYYILLDAYGGTRSLRDTLSFDNSPFLARMAARGFRDASREHSNYLRTEETLGGIFSLHYPHTVDPSGWNDPWRLYPGLLETKQAPALIARLQADGYATWFSASVVAGCPSLHVRCLNNLVAVDALYIAQSFLSPTPVGRMLMHVLDRRRNALEPLARQLPALLAAHQPMFVFAHHVSPHPPYSLDRNCQPVKSGLEMWKGSLEEQRVGYLGALECVNAQVQQLVDRIIALDPQALIVLQSDHGSDLTMKWGEPMASWTDAEVGERTSYLNLIRAPTRCASWLDRPLGQINTARFVLACAEARAPEFLPEHTYISKYWFGPDEGVVREWHPSREARAAPTASMAP